MSILIWWFYVLFLGLGFMPLSGFIFRRFEDRGWIFSKSIALLISSMVFFWLNSMHLLKFVQKYIFLVTIVLIVLNFAAFIRLKMQPIFKDINLRLVLIEEGLFLFIYLLWVWIIGFKPEAYGTEKFMDYGFITAMMRALWLPFQDMWYSGETINYYYGGQYVTAWLIKLAGIDSGVGYNVMRALVVTFSFCAPFSLVWQLMRDRFGDKGREAPWVSATLAGWAVAFCGNFHYVIYGLIKPLVASIRGSEYNYWFPDSTRYIGYDPDLPDKTIHEYPAYSSVLGDLHAHYLDILFVVTVTAIAYAFAQRILAETNAEDKKTGPITTKSLLIEILAQPEIILIGFFTGIFRFTNFWDFPIYFVVCGSIVFFMNLWRYEGDIVRFLVVMGGQAAEAFTIGYIACLPFTVSFDQISSEIGLVHSHTVLYQFLILWGLPILILGGLIVMIILEQLRWKRKLNRRGEHAKKSRTRVFLDLRMPDLVVLLIGFCALGLILMPEVIYVKDIYSGEHYRANTMFKLTYQAFILFGMMMGYSIERCYLVGKKVGRIFALTALVLVVFTAGYTFKSVNSWFGNVFDPRDRISTDASVFVDESFTSDYGAICWLNNKVSGSPVVLEAPGDSYSDYQRVSVATGLPTILGWYVHEWLWRNDTDAMNVRAADAQTIYTSTDEETVRQLIRKYDIAYIYIGQLERQKYPDLNDEMLQKIGKVAYSDGETTYIMRVK